MVLLPLHVTEVAATTAKLASWKLPFGAKVLDISVAVRVSSGTGRTLKLDVKGGDASILSEAAATVEASIDASKAMVADESVLTVGAAVGGSDSPKWQGVDVLITLVRV